MTDCPPRGGGDLCAARPARRLRRRAFGCAELRPSSPSLHPQVVKSHMRARGHARGTTVCACMVKRRHPKCWWSTHSRLTRLSWLAKVAGGGGALAGSPGGWVCGAVRRRAGTAGSTRPQSRSPHATAARAWRHGICFAMRADHTQLRRNQPVRIQSAAFVSAAGGRATRRTARAVFPGAAPHWWHIANILIYHTHRVIPNCPDQPFTLATQPSIAVASRVGL